MADRVTRWLGLAGAVGGVLWAVFPVAFLAALYGGGVGSLLSPMGEYFFTALFIPLGLMAAGVVGVDRLHRDRFGRIGRAGTSISLLGFLFFLPSFLVGMVPALSGLDRATTIAAFTALAIGAVLLGLDARRASLLPSAVPTLLAIAIPGGVLIGGGLLLAGAGAAPLAAGLILPYGVAWTIIGTMVWRDSG